MLIKAFLIAAAFSFFIYAEALGKSSELLNTLTGVVAIYFILKADKKELFWIGFFIGILWFYWIGLSFRYYNLFWMIPIVILFVGVVYGIIFWLIGKLTELITNIFSSFSIYLQPFIKSLFLSILNYIHPFGFNWFIPELIFLNSYLESNKSSFLIILLSISFLTLYNRFEMKKRVVFVLAAISLLIFAKKEIQTEPKLAPIKIYLSQTSLPQDKKWDPLLQTKIIDENFKIIEEAIKKRYDLVVLPETAFPLYLNTRKNILNTLKKMSEKISIVAGALHLKEGLSYNSTYIFTNGDYIIADKVVLVPFGEAVPLPKPLAKLVNKVFFNGAEDYKRAKYPTDFEINGIRFRNAICYEATHPLLYKNTPKYLIAISNNAWFTPSIEPTLQNLIIKYYAKSHKIVVYHSTNIAKTAVIW